jgi:hypothetical protein
MFWSGKLLFENNSPSRNATVKINEGIAFRRLTDECISSFFFFCPLFFFAGTIIYRTIFSTAF